ncbi:hypothetical protein [Christiangramia echinicola]|uniref:Uncharacterized protein n=1 Tax=Christiangramia echinicola TaxID=279359 RepID=A0A1H1LBU5_9FLAO|nr:hypothetical protein [Christiangramia echinicola]SDR71349.1 hypothetical protein SAMN04488552_0656 [Christiangramia echinicola]
MWNKIEFSDLYKFITSIGLLFIASAFIIPWLFLNQISGLQLSQEDYNVLTRKSKELFNNQIDISLWIVNNVKYIFWILISIGIICICLGLYFWIKKQKIKDQIEIYNRDKLKLEALNPEATDVKREKDIKEEFEISNTPSNTTNNEQLNQEKPREKPTVENLNKLKQNLENVENRFFEKITDYNPFNYQAQSNVRIDNFIIDIILKSNIRNRYKDIYIEIKFFQKNLNFELFKKSFGQTVRLRNHIYHKTNEVPKFHLFVVYRNDIGTSEEISRFKKTANEYLQQFRDINVDVKLLSEEEFNNFNVKKIFD